MHTLIFPAEAAECEGQRLFSLYSGRTPERALPDCLLLAGFDPLMLGYEKKQSVFLPPEYLRGIFSLSGIVMPPVLLRESGTEPVIRVMAEAQEQRVAEACVNEMIDAIKAEGLA